MKEAARVKTEPQKLIFQSKSNMLSKYLENMSVA